MTTHDKRNQVSFHIYILQMQRSPTPRALNSKQPAKMGGWQKVGPAHCWGPNLAYLKYANWPLTLLPPRTIMIHCKSGQVFLFSLCPAALPHHQQTKRSKSQEVKMPAFLSVFPQGPAEQKWGDVPGFDSVHIFDFTLKLASLTHKCSMQLVHLIFVTFESPFQLYCNQKCDVTKRHQ